MWLVMDHERQEPVAQKRILTQDPKVLLLFKREFRSVTNLRHPNIVKLYELGEDEEGLYFTMEPIDGWDLEDYFNAAIDVGRWNTPKNTVVSDLPFKLNDSTQLDSNDATQLETTWAATSLASSLDEPTQLQKSPRSLARMTCFECSPMKHKAFYGSKCYPNFWTP